MNAPRPSSTPPTGRASSLAIDNSCDCANDEEAQIVAHFRYAVADDDGDAGQSTDAAATLTRADYNGTATGPVAPSADGGLLCPSEEFFPHGFDGDDDAPPSHDHLPTRSATRFAGRAEVPVQRAKANAVSRRKRLRPSSAGRPRR